MTAPDQPAEHALRDQVRDTIHAASPTCTDYHAADCRPCIARASLVVRLAVQPVLDAKDAQIERLKKDLNDALGYSARLLALMERIPEQHMRFGVIGDDGTTEMLPCADWCWACNIERAEKRAEAAEAEVARLTAELAQARADLGRYDHYATQIGAKEPGTQ